MRRARIIAASDAGREPRLRETWEKLLDENSGTTLFYQSPGYFDHLARFRLDCAFLAIVEEDDGAPIGVVPLRKEPVLLKFEVGGRRFAHVSFSGVRILGGTLLAPQSPDVLEHLFQQIAYAFPDCAAMEVNGVSTTSPLWRFLKSSEPLQRMFTIYSPYGPRNCHTAPVAGSYAEYLGAFGRKKQYNLKRQIGRLEQFGDGGLILRRIDRASSVNGFLSAWAGLEQPVKHGDREIPEAEMLDLAERGLLLSYVLSAGGKPCAIVFATRFRDTLVIHSLRHDADIAHLSPGTVLHTLMMKDLSEHQLARRIDYGFGEPRYRLANDVDERVTAVVVRKGLFNRSLITAHRSFTVLLDGIKRLLPA